MTRYKVAHAFVLIVALASCKDAATPVSPDLDVSTARGAGGIAAVRIMDACDPATFAVVPGGCQRSGGITLDQFTAQLTALRTVPEWKFTPPDLYIREGDTFQATNHGGENHTFTEVEEFGGGVVANLNQLAGITTVAPECLTAVPSGLLAPGESSEPDTPDEVGDEHYQCCIHPWMRMTVHIRAR